MRKKLRDKRLKFELSGSSKYYEQLEERLSFASANVSATRKTTNMDS